MRFSAAGTMLLPLLAGLLAPAVASGQERSPLPPADHVVLISVDGLRPDFYLESRWPAVTMREMAREGAHARGVRGVHPTVTYPSHTTIVTGALPARHGIFYNAPFEPGGSTGRWYWESSYLTTPTLWDAVHEVGGTSGALWWPVTVGAPIDWNLPEIWPLDNSDRTAALRARSTRDFLAELEENAVGPLDDSFRAAWLSRADRMGAMAAYTLRTHRPDLLLVHFTTTDSHQHSYGREHVMVERAVQAVDRGIARIVEAAEEAGMLERTAFVITGDHGFSDIHTEVAPNVWLVEAGLMEDRRDRGEWRATFHMAGGSAFLHLRDPGDQGAVEEVRRLLEALPAGTRRLFQVIDRDVMDRYGADPNSPLSLSGVNGVAMSGASSGAAVRPGSGGTHGHFPDFADMETGFVAWGAGVRKGARVPSMGLEDVAPVVAHLLGLPFEAPDGILIPGLVDEVPAPAVGSGSSDEASAAAGAGSVDEASAARVPGDEGLIPPMVDAHRNHYRSFPSADSLAGWLDPRSGAGVLVSAHRGGPAPGHPENALSTFERSVGHGPMLIELDLRASSDGHIVVLHDDSLERATGKPGTVGDLPLEQLRGLPLRDADGATTEARLPSFQDALAWAEGRAVLRLDVKQGVTPAMVVEEVRRADAMNRVMVTAQGLEQVALYQALAPELVVSFWHDPDRDGVLSPGEAREVLRAPFDPTRLVVGVGSIRDGWDAGVLDTLRKAGLRGMVSTFGELDRQAMEEGRWEAFCPLVDAGVGILITDAVEAAARAVREC